jgi:transcriptional regulator with XRE-family HTH domain
MKYGQMIRVARKKLGLNQSDLSNKNISRTLISEIEKENTKLVESKALMIYKKLVKEAYIQDQPIDLDFDGVLKNNFEYVQLKQAREILIFLTDAKKEQKRISKFELENYRLFALRGEIGIFKYFIFRELALHSEDNNEFKVKVLFNALDYLKWLNFKHIHEHYDDTLKAVTPIAYKERLFKELIHYYKYQRDSLIEIEGFIEARVYFNLSLLYEDIGNYEKAFNFLDKYFEYKTRLTLKDYYDALLGKARLSTRSGKYREGIKLYEELLQLISGEKYKLQRSIVLGNMLFNIPKLEEDYSEDKIYSYLEELNEMMLEVLEMRNFPSELLVNIGIGYGLINKKEKSIEYVYKAFEYATSNDLIANIIVDTFNNIKKENIDFDLIVRKIPLVDIDRLIDKHSFMVVLLKLQRFLYKSGKSQYLKILDEYIEKI